MSEHGPYNYLVWCPDDGETIDDALRIAATSSQHAAEIRAELDYGIGGDPFESIDYHVKRVDKETVKLITVDVEHEVTFSAFDSGKIAADAEPKAGGGG